MTILQELISLRGEGRLTYSQEGFLASHFQRQESEGERKMTVISGRKCFGQYGRYDPLGLLVRTLLESPAWYNPAVRLRWKVKPLCLKRLTRKRYSSKNTLSRPSAEILSVRDIPSSRFLFQLAVSEPLTGGTGYGSLLPTVQTQGLKVCGKNGKTKFMDVSLLPTPTAQDFRRRGPNSKQQGLPEADYKGLLLTPKANSWKTPCEHGEGSPDLQTYIAKKIGETSQLNPLFVSDMMGFPIMWCDI